MWNSLKFLIKFFIGALIVIFILMKIDPYSLPNPVAIPLRDFQIYVIGFLVQITPNSVTLPSTQSYENMRSHETIVWTPPVNPVAPFTPHIVPNDHNSLLSTSNNPSVLHDTNTTNQGICIPSDPSHESPTISKNAVVTIADNQSSTLTANLPEWERMLKDRGVSTTIHLHLYESTNPGENTSRTYPPPYPDQPIEMYVDLHAVNRGIMPGFPYKYLIGDGKTGYDFGTAVSLHESGHACLFAKGQIQKAYSEPLVEEYSHYWYGSYQLIIPK